MSYLCTRKSEIPTLFRVIKIVQVNKKRGVFLVIKKERRRTMFTNTAMVLMLTMVGISTICGCTSLMGRR
jgi:hypothetical protein